MIVNFEGQQHDFPDDFSQADIAKALSSHVAPTEQAKVQPSTFAGRVGSNFIDPFYGQAQTGSKIQEPGSEMAGVFPQLDPTQMYQQRSAQLDATVAQRKNEYDASRSAAGSTGFDFAKPLGHAANAAVDPWSYLGPGGPALKIGGALLSSVGSDVGRQMAEGTGYEGAASLGGALLGGAGAVKTLGATAEKAAVPTLQELKSAATRDYTAARSSGLELHPKAMSDFAAPIEQELTNGPKYAFTGGKNGTAPRTFDLLGELQNAPAGAKVTAGNLDTLRMRIGNIAGETKDFKPTPDAKAAMVLKGRFNQFLENPPQNHILAGSPEDYASSIKEANGNYAAYSRGSKIDTKLTAAENNAQGGIATSPDNQIKSQIRNTILNKPKAQRGFSAEELTAMQKINDGTFTSNVLRQLGRGGTGVIPMAMHAASVAPTAVATGGASVPIQAGLAAALYGSKKIAERMTMNRAQALSDMLAKRSPEYESRAAALPAQDTMSNKAAMIRALLATQH